METELITCNEHLKNHYSSIFDRLFRIASWEESPPFKSIGRSGWLRLDEPMTIKLKGMEVKINSVKIKGCGLLDHKNNVTPPSRESFYRSQVHLGIGKDGQFLIAKSPPSPLGGMIYERAKSEYDISQKLLESGALCQVPLLLCKYLSQDLAYMLNGKSHLLGAVFTGLMTQTSLRCDRILDIDSLLDKESEEMDDWIGLFGLEQNENTKAGLLCSVMEIFGQELRKFHQSGFYRYSGGLSNYAIDPVNKRVFLIDLDSSRPMSECNSIQAPL